MLVFGSDVTTSTSSTQGFMPLKGQFGYAFNPTNLVKTIAHELGHGVFGLKHPYEEFGIAEGVTGYLMDKGDGTVLNHTDWKRMHEPGIQLNWFQKDESGELAGSVWLTPDWKPFSYNNSRTITSDASQTNIPKGAVPGILHEDEHYLANGLDFKGYVIKGNTLPITLETLALNSKVLLHRDNGGCGTDTYYETTWGYIKDKKNNFSFDDKEITFKGEIPCAKKTTNDNSRCNQFTYIDDNKDKELLQKYPKSIENALQNGLSSISNTRGNRIRTKGSYSHIQFANTTTYPTNLSNLERLEDKLHLLSHYDPQTFMVVTFLKIENNLYCLNYQANDLAQKAITNTTNANGKKVVHIVVPFSDYESILGVGFANSDSCYNIGFAESQTGIVKNTTSLRQRESVFKDILGVYTHIEKPLYIKQFFMKADGSMLETIVRSNSISGYDAIHALQIFSSTYTDKISVKRKEHNRLIAKYIGDGIDPLRNKPLTDEERRVFWSQYNEDKSEINRLYREAQYYETDLSLSSNKRTWKLISPDNLSSLREPYRIDAKISQAYFTSQTATYGYGEKFSIYFGSNETLDNETHFYDFDKYQVIDPLVYGIADGLSFIPWVDSVGDGIGMLYATYRGDIGQAPFYAAGLAIPIVGGSYLKQGSKSVDNLYAVVARNSENGITLEAKLVSQIQEGELQVTTVLGDKASDAQKALVEVKQYEKEIAKYFDEVGDNLRIVNKIPQDKNVTNHIFSSKPNKLVDTPANRKFLEQLTNNLDNLRGTDKYGKEWYATMKDGKQYYAYTKNGTIKGAGINDVPLSFLNCK